MSENLMQHHSSKGYNDTIRPLGAICEEGTTYCNPVGHQKICFPSVLTQSSYIPSNLSVRPVLCIVLSALIMPSSCYQGIHGMHKLSWLLPAALLPESASRLNCSCSRRLHLSCKWDIMLNICICWKYFIAPSRPKSSAAECNLRQEQVRLL